MTGSDVIDDRDKVTTSEIGGRTIGQYEVIEKLAEGGMAAVYRARQSILGRDVALKVLHPDLLYQRGVLDSFRAAVDTLASLGAEIIEVACPNFDYALAAYYLIAPSECSSNLARFDAVRYGLRVGDDGGHSLEEVMSLTREAGFGPEVKRRIMIGTYALSSGYYEAYYGQAQKVRTLIARDFASAFNKADVLVSPTSPFVAFGIGERVADPMAMYVNDLCTLPASLAGTPAISVPCGLSSETGPALPVGLQIMAPAMADDRCYRVGAAFEAAYVAANGPILDGIPILGAAR